MPRVHGVSRVFFFPRELAVLSGLKLQKNAIWWRKIVFDDGDLIKMEDEIYEVNGEM